MINGEQFAAFGIPAERQIREVRALLAHV